MPLIRCSPRLSDVSIPLKPSWLRRMSERRYLQGSSEIVQSTWSFVLAQVSIPYTQHHQQGFQCHTFSLKQKLLFPMMGIPSACSTIYTVPHTLYRSVSAYPRVFCMLRVATYKKCALLTCSRVPSSRSTCCSSPLRTPRPALSPHRMAAGRHRSSPAG